MHSLFLIAFWLPPTISILAALSWNLRFWQKQGFDIREVSLQLRSDFSLTHRRHYRSVIKLISFVLVATFLTGSESPLPLIGVLLAYTIWSSDIYLFAEHVIGRLYPWRNWSWRNYIHLLILLILYSLPIVISLQTIGGSPWPVQNFSTLVQVLSRGELASVTNAFYIYLVVATLWCLVWDLASVFWSSIAVLLTSPVVALHRYWQVGKARTLLHSRPELVTVLISGSYGKSTIRQFIEQISSGYLNLASLTQVHYSNSTLSTQILDNVLPDTQLLIVEAENLRPGELKRIITLLNPRIAIFSGIDRSHIARFGDKDTALRDTLAAISTLRSNSHLVVNADDPLSHTLNSETSTLHWYSTQTNPQKLISTDTAGASFNWLEVKNLRNSFEAEFHLAGTVTEAKLSSAFFGLEHSLMAATLTAHLTGLGTAEIIGALENYIPHLPNVEEMNGDNNTHIIFSDKRPSIARLRTLLRYAAAKFPGHKRVLLCPGIDRLGSEKHKVYADLSALIHMHIDVLITYDLSLSASIKQHNLSTQVMEVRDVADMLYAARSYAEPETCFLLLGEPSDLILDSLRN